MAKKEPEQLPLLDGGNPPTDGVLEKELDHIQGMIEHTEQEQKHPEWESLSLAEKDLVSRQLTAMKTYRDIIAERIYNEYG